MDHRGDLSRAERLLLLLPALASVVFGLGPILLPGPFWQFLLPGRINPYIYELAGAAMFGYAVALFGALRQPRWVPIRLVVLAVLVFNLGSLVACGTALAGGAPATSIYVIGVVALGFVALTAILLARHGLAPAGPPDLAPWLVGLLGIATLAATVFGLFPLFLPGVFGTFFGYQATDTFLYQQAGAATLGYAVMGVFELRSRQWAEVRWPLVMATVFNGLSFVASLLALSTGQAGWLPIVVTPATLLITAGFLYALTRRPSPTASVQRS